VKRIITIVGVVMICAASNRDFLNLRLIVGFCPSFSSGKVSPTYLLSWFFQVTTRMVFGDSRLLDWKAELAPLQLNLAYKQIYILYTPLNEEVTDYVMAYICL